MEHPTPATVGFVSAVQETRAVYLMNCVTRVPACVDHSRAALDLLQDPIAMLPTMYANVHQQLMLVVEHQIPVLVVFASVALEMHVAMAVKPVVREIACVELPQLAWERRQGLIAMLPTVSVNVQKA